VLRSLQILSIGNAPIGDDAMKHLAGLTLLKELDLTGTRVGDAGLNEITGLQHLEKLTLTGTRFSDAGLKELAGLQRLKWLDPTSTRIQGQGLKDLAGLKRAKEARPINPQQNECGRCKRDGVGDVEPAKHGRHCWNAGHETRRRPVAEGIAQPSDYWGMTRLRRGLPPRLRGRPNSWTPNWARLVRRASHRPSTDFPALSPWGTAAGPLRRAGQIDRSTKVICSTCSGPKHRCFSGF
jgi:hypothetical protein